MRSDLNQLKIAQEIYFNDPVNNYTYSSDETALEFNPTTGVSVDAIAGDADGWTATVSHTNATGWTCDYDSDVGSITCTEA
jgi:hypothetical protein